MTNHDLLVLGMTAVWLVTNFLGAAFTIRHLRGLRREKSPKVSRPVVF